MLYSRSEVTTLFSNWKLISFDQHLTSPTQPLVATRVLCAFLSWLFNFTYKWDHAGSTVFLTVLLSIIFSGFLHVLTSDRISLFLRLKKIPLWVHLCSLIDTLIPYLSNEQCCANISLVYWLHFLWNYTCN